MATKDFEIKQGATFSQVLRWEAKPFVYVPITGISQAAPAVISVASHSIPDGWRVAIVSAKGMRQINASNPPRPHEFHQATVVSPTQIALNDVNSADFDAYTSGGYIQHYTPVDLAGYTARLTIKDEVGGTVLDTLTTENGGITLDNVAKTITLTVPAVDTAAYTWGTGVYDLELVSGTGVVTALLSGNVRVTEEVTT